MERIYRLIHRKRLIEEQAEEYLQGLSEGLRDRRRPFIEIFLETTEALSISRVEKGDYKRFADRIYELYGYHLYRKDALTAVRLFISHFRALGLPAIPPSELKAIAYE